MSLDGSQTCKWGGHGAVASDESAVKVCETQETLKSLAVIGFGPLLYHLDLLRVHADATGRDDVTKEGGRGAGELGLHEEPILQEPMEDLAHMGGMCSSGVFEKMRMSLR